MADYSGVYQHYEGTEIECNGVQLNRELTYVTDIGSGILRFKDSDGNYHQFAEFIGDLDGIDTSSMNSGQILKWDGNKLIPVSHISDQDIHASVSGITSGFIPYWASSKWEDSRMEVVSGNVRMHNDEVSSFPALSGAYGTNDDLIVLYGPNDVGMTILNDGKEDYYASYCMGTKLHPNMAEIGLFCNGNHNKGHTVQMSISGITVATFNKDMFTTFKLLRSWGEIEVYDELIYKSNRFANGGSSGSPGSINISGVVNIEIAPTDAGTDNYFTIEPGTSEGQMIMIHNTGDTGAVITNSPGKSISDNQSIQCVYYDSIWRYL